ncbi:MAG: cell filamentation protein Fic [Gammaproteobacteria bacterium]|nr:cell filamentation protein Fic [Gammaproteobacteria bacterium]
MAKPSEKLAESLKVLKALQDVGEIAVHTSRLTRAHRERLIENGFLQEVMKGWYIPIRPDESMGESTAWYTSFWAFCAAFLNKRFGDEWCLSPEQSLSLQVGNWRVPTQLLVRAPKGNNKVTTLLHNTSLFDARYPMPVLSNAIVKDGLRLYTLPAALVACPPGCFKQNSIDMRAALSSMREADDMLVLLLEGGHSVIAGRLAGAFRDIGRAHIADEIMKTMRSAGYSVRETNPFSVQQSIVFLTKERSPYVNRLRIMWREMRSTVTECFPAAPGLPNNTKNYLKQVEANYITDAYHSLSIEGYRVSPELIERVRSNAWSLENDETDLEYKNALAARGYWQAFQSVEKSIKQVLQGKNSGEVFEKNYRDWYRQLFGPSVTAGILKPGDLAGYRNGPVYIRRSMHVPPSCESVRDLMPALSNLLVEESESSVRIVLGHFFFVYIHPYFDGNGRMGRFLMNLMLASGGYAWTVIPVEERQRYMVTLEKASVRQNIAPFVRFIAELVKRDL